MYVSQIGLQVEGKKCIQIVWVKGYLVVLMVLEEEQVQVKVFHFHLMLKQIQMCNFGSKDYKKYRIDSWDNEYGYIFVDYQMGWSKRYQYYDGTQMCGGGGDWREAYINLNLKIKHSGSTAVIVVTSNIDEGPENESWGIRDFILSVEMCPEGCLICQLNDSIIDCYVWKFLKSSWTQMNINEIVIDGWNVFSGIGEATQCGSVALFGGYQKTGTKTVISKTFYNIPPHYKLKIQILWAKIDSWDNEAAQMRVDNVLIWERRFQWYEGYFGKICGDWDAGHRTIFVRIEQDLIHSNNQVEIKFTTTLDESFDGESFGLRDFVIFYGSCTDNCDQCTGPTGSECQMCSKGCYNTGVDDKICQLCYPSCYLCDGPTIEDCTDCGDPNIFHKQLVAGQCICAIRTIESIQNDGTSLCLPCHSNCEKCYQPFDNTSNQYCTMCRTGLNRVVSDDLNCICKRGYGDDGISDVCVQCHYTCENCKGSLATDCTSCSIQSNRHLTFDNQCLCNKAYIDSGINDIKCLYICHSSCSDCDISGEDKCTSCPSTRLPDRSGTTFKCICKDSHYFSDNLQLECLPCHFTCKTCNGIYENNCLTCDLTLRQLVMFKCICPNRYYDIGLLQCSPCHYTCLTCFGPEVDNCLTCSISNYREVKANKCLCLDTYMEKQTGDPQCYKCSYRCANCIGTIDNCTSCPSFSFRDLGINNSCSCPIKSYDEPGNPICIICHNTCLTCNGNQQNQCTSCNVQIMRQLDLLGQCLCINKYYDVGQPECKTCSPYCLNCLNTADNCISCKSDRYLQDNICVCKTKLNGAMISSYQVQGKTECQSCHYSCLNCNGSTISKCTSCLDSEMRVLQNGSCICVPHYLDNGKPKCLECNYRCENCAGIETSCLSCYQNSFRNLVNQQCKCQKGYYDDGQNVLCQKCHYSCSECSSKETKCDSCSLISNRQYNQQLFTCSCQESYYDSGVEICSQCHYSCLGCNGQGKDQCKSCLEKSISYRVLNNRVCQCLNGYYDDGSSPNCKNCQIQCFTCQNKEDNCTSCPTTRHLDGNTCICDQGYYDNKGDKCLKCDDNCINCSISSKNCSECDLTLQRILDKVTHRCICKDGSTELNGTCVNCDLGCLTCLNYINYCTSCKTLKLLINNKCQCIDGTYESGNDKQCLYCNTTCQTCINQENYCTSCSADKNRIFKTGNICICQDGYYEDLVTLSCQRCDLSCLTCMISAIHCMSCDSQYNLSLNNQNKCICSSGFYFNTSNLKCEACNIQCKECQTLSQCIECEISTRYYDAENLKCPCKDGYYDTNLKKCQLCNLSCKTCINLSTNCLSCEPIHFRVLNYNQCLCLDGYYDVGIEMCQLCNKLCKTCQMSSTKCFSCFETQHFRQLSFNQCICQNGYYDNGQLICEKCSNQCYTCSGKRDNCTSCDINQNRLDQSIIKKCPCLSGFYQDNNENCQKCHLQCSTCQQQSNNCMSCSTSITSNRQSLSKNCICKDGYYDDGTQVDCLKCSIRCKLCQNSSTNCQTCSSNLRDTPPICNCKQGFYEDSFQNCQPCENQCVTCQDNSFNCLSCKEGRFTQQCLCEDGYYEGGQPLCLQCAFQCQACKDSSLNCLICKGDRINIPLCKCPDGFYDDFINESCQICDRLCKTCNIDGCLICNGNRILSSEMICDPPSDSITHINTPWCSTCTVAVIDIRFSDDLLSILVKFDFPLDHKFFVSQFQDNICLKILYEQTYKSLGKNPICYIDPNDNTILILKIGQQVTIIPGDKILFYENSFGHQDCDQKLNIFIFNQVQLPINPVSPKIIFDIPTYLINPCDDNTITLKSKINDGLRGLNGIIWKFSVDGSNGNGNLQNFVDFLTNQQMLELIIPFQTLPKQSNITFVIEFLNFVSQKSTQYIKFQTHSGQFPTILWISKPLYYAFETVVLEFQIKKKDCSESTTNIQIDNSQYQVSIVEVYRNDSNSRSSRVNHSEITSNSFFNVSIQNYTLTSRIAYTFQQTTLDILMNFSISRNITLEISSGGILCLFNGTKKIQNYRKETQIFISCKDLDTQYPWNEDSGIQITVSCVDLTMNTHCMDLNKKILQINKTDSVQTIPKQTIQPYTIQSWQVVATKKQFSYTFKQNIVYLDNDFKLLNVSYKKGYKMRPINNYENLEFIINIPFEERQYILDFQVAIIYNFELIKILQSEYFSFQFRIFDYFQEFNRGNQINLKFLAQFTNEIVPSQEDLQIIVNLPPTCIVSLAEQSTEALQPYKIITICDFTENAPFTYQLRYFITNTDFIDFENRTSDYSLILNNFQSSNTFEGFFPFTDGVILISAMDSKGSYLNIEKHINVTRTKLNCLEININNYNFKQLISLFLEILLNHLDLNDCSSLSQQLYFKIKTYLGAEDINNQLLVYQTTKLYKRLIQHQNNKKSKRLLLNDNSQERCFENSTQQIYFQTQKINNLSTYTPTNLSAELKQIKAVTQQLIQKQTDFVDQINSNDIFLDEQLYQKKEAILNSLQVLLLLIDDIFEKIQTALIISNQDKEKIMSISIDLISLIEKIANQISIQAQVNGQELIINGQILKWQLSKITKELFNRQFDISNDFLDGMIDFVQKEQIDLNYNHLNLSDKLQKELQTLFNINSTIEIDEKIYKKVNLKNHLYNNNYIEYKNTLKKYIIDMFQFQYCEQQIPQQYLFTYQCVTINNESKSFKCDLLNEKINKTTLLVSCQCEQLGSILLIRYQNNQIIQQNITQVPYNHPKKDNSELKLSENPILLFHSIYISFSFFLYFQLLLFEIKKNQISIFKQEETDHSISVEQNRKGNNLEFYPGNLFVFKLSFKFIHEILSLFYTESKILTKSYRFLQFSIKISLLIPFVYEETYWLNQITIFTIFLINCGFFLLIKMILKIIQSIYRFGGKWSISIIILFCLIHFFCYLEFIIQLRQCQEDIDKINLESFLIFVCSLFLFYVLADPILIFSRIIIFKQARVEIRNQQISPTYQLLYFFVWHQKLDNLFDSYAIM
ncbi:unnamed protein product [Paramecium sonneborni]|uniref:EGF-like domain-containing protein n=1 Tax=Paramecium sonneborni TaxID=65129 RepID=A0A8S1QEQ4_9CILI|nr:unnamed protein product [Paramecium sonneborni]